MSLFGVDSDSDEDKDVIGSCQPELLLKNRSEDSGVLKWHNGVEEACFLFVADKCKESSDETKVKDILVAMDIFAYSRHWYVIYM
jgi:hypothetical protein